MKESEDNEVVEDNEQVSSEVDGAVLEESVEGDDDNNQDTEKIETSEDSKESDNEGIEDQETFEMKMTSASNEEIKADVIASKPAEEEEAAVVSNVNVADNDTSVNVNEQETKVDLFEQFNKGMFDDEPITPIFEKQTNCRKIFLFVQKLLSMIEVADPDLCFTLRLHSAIAANRCVVIAQERSSTSGDLSTVAYEFITEAFLIYEREITDALAQRNAITKMIGILLSCSCFDKNDYEALITKTTQYAARLLKKTDQCSMVLMCSHLFFKLGENGYQNPQRALECLQRALKIADMCATSNPSNLQLFVDIFDLYVYFFENSNPVITDKFLSGLIALVNEHITTIGSLNSVIQGTKESFTQTVRYIERKKTVDGRFTNIVCIVPN
mmetsp:Transcript_13212/g.15359  ORF Transcript_13212/g.15359 Transcript_13212/m.15359 type:complete len:384 (+) Transcript_13212:1-1152(+)